MARTFRSPVKSRFASAIGFSLVRPTKHANHTKKSKRKDFMSFVRFVGMVLEEIQTRIESRICEAVQIGAGERRRALALLS
jgi:hypothetical protein